MLNGRLQAGSTSEGQSTGTSTGARGRLSGASPYHREHRQGGRLSPLSRGGGGHLD